MDNSFGQDMIKLTKKEPLLLDFLLFLWKRIKTINEGKYMCRFKSNLPYMEVAFKLWFLCPNEVVCHIFQLFHRKQKRAMLVFRTVPIVRYPDAEYSVQSEDYIVQWKDNNDHKILSMLMNHPGWIRQTIFFQLPTKIYVYNITIWSDADNITKPETISSD